MRMSHLTTVIGFHHDRASFLAFRSALPYICTILLTLIPVVHLPMTFHPTSHIFHYPLPARLAQPSSVGNNPYATLIPHGTHAHRTSYCLFQSNLPWTYPHKCPFILLRPNLLHASCMAHRKPEYTGMRQHELAVTLFYVPSRLCTCGMDFALYVSISSLNISQTMFHFYCPQWYHRWRITKNECKYAYLQSLQTLYAVFYPSVVPVKIQQEICHLNTRKRISRSTYKQTV